MARKTTKEITIYIVIDANGDYAVSDDKEQAFETLTENTGETAETRCVTMKVTVPLPKPAEPITITLPESDSDKYQVTVA